MTTMNISLPEALKTFVDEQVAAHGFGTTSEFVRALIRREQERQAMRRILLEGAQSEPGPVADRAYFEGLRERIKATETE